MHALLGEYLSFIVLLFALYVVAGGILVTGNLRGTPLVNTAILAFGTLIASVVGTTGAAMILIRPLIARQCRAAAQRPCGGVLHHPGRQYRRRADAARRSAAVRRLPARRRFLLDRAASLAADRARRRPVLAIFVAARSAGYYRKDRLVTTVGETRRPCNLRVRGGINLAADRRGSSPRFCCSACGSRASPSTSTARTFELQNIAARRRARADRTPLARAHARTSIARPTASPGSRSAKSRSCSPASSSASFRCWPCSQAGRTAPSRWLLAAVTASDGSPHEVAYFWLTGILSAFLDNAPTYLVFFELAGGDAARADGSARRARSRRSRWARSSWAR